MKQKQLRQHQEVRRGSSLLLKMFALVALMLCSVGSVWGQTSLGKVEISSTVTANNAGWQKFGANGVIKEAWIFGTAEIKNPAGYYVKITDQGKIKLRFTPGAVRAGDILKVNVGPSGDNSENLGYTVEGSNSFAQAGTGNYTMAADVNYTLCAKDIYPDPDDSKYEVIVINRSGGGYAYAYHSVEIERPAGHTVVFEGLYGGGKVTAKRTDINSEISSGWTVPDGTQVTFTPVPNGENLAWKWIIDGADKYSQDPQTITVNKDITVNHEFGSVFVNVYTNNASLGTVNIKHGEQNATSFHVTPWAGEFTLTATATANGKFMGWYKDADHTQKINDAEATYNINNPSGTNNYFAYFVEDANTITKPGCGGEYMDQSKLNAGTATLNVSGGKGTVTTGASGGYVYVKFDQAYDLTNLKKYKVDGTNIAANLNNVEFLKNGTGITDGNFYSGCSDKDLTDKNKNSVLTSVDEIRFHFKENTTTTIEYIYFEVDHGPRTKPTLAAPTTTEMKIFSDETLQLRITNTNGYWREYTNDSYNTETTEHGVGVKSDGTADWKPSYDISGLEVGDYYFEIKDGGNCAENNKYHESGSVRVHVKVIDPIPSIEVNGTKRNYDLYIPEGLTSSATDKVGVVLSLHRKDYDYDEGRVDFNPVADSEKNNSGKKFVVVYPRALVRDGHRTWQLDESSADDTEFFKAIVKKINDDNNNLTVDYSRVYLAGYSDGGAMAFKVAHKDADFYSAIASVSGVPSEDSHLWHAGKKPVPFLFIQGANDGIFNALGTTNVTTIAHNMMYRNGAAFAATNGTLDIKGTNNDIVYDCHEAETGGAAFYHYTIPGMYHQSDFDWDGTTGDDVAPTVWAFFNKSDKVKSLDETLKFRVNDPTNFWTKAGDYGFVKGAASSKDVLAYGGSTKTNENKNIYHSLQFDGGVNGAPHFLKMNIETTNVGGAENEVATDYFLVTLTKVGADVPVFAKRYQAGRGQKDLYINFAALPNLNEYKLTITKSRADLLVNVHGVEFYSGRCEDKSQVENPVYFKAISEVVANLNPIYQPVYGTTFDGLAKEYLPIANIPIGQIEETHVATSTTRHYKVIEDNLKVNGSELKTTLTGGKLPSQWGAATTSTTVTGTGYKNLYVSGHPDEKITNNRKVNNIAYILGSNSYTVDPVKGLNISQHGRAEMVEYLNGTNGDFPTKGMLAIKFEGTCDFTLLAENDITYPADDANQGRSTLKVYYTNDQMDGELKELKEWWFYGTRSEANGNDHTKGEDTNGNEKGNDLNTLSASIRLPQLGKDGKCTVFITYEGRGQHAGPFEHKSGDDNKIWIKGFVIKRPDLKVTIGRTDRLYEGQNRGYENNTSLTRFGENRPYIWSFENVGFNNTKNANLNDKKVNENDWRTYVCGGTDDSVDHLLVYSDIASSDPNDKAQFDGRLAGQEHIEFRNPSQYTMKDLTYGGNKGRLEFNPITSNGLKVNVTGSGWFKIKCSAPNGKVKMKVYSSTNYGITYTNLLREFIVDNNNHPASATGEEEHKWGEYTVYLKGHVELKKNEGTQEGFWDGDEIRYNEDKTKDAEEKVRMSLYIVFDACDDVDYKEDGTGSTASPQLNIHQLSWLNEKPADYVFQREEDPKLLSTWQEIKRNGNTVLWWKAANDTDNNGYTILKENNQNTYDVTGQFTTKIKDNMGLKSPDGYASISVPSDAGTYDAYWDISAKPVTHAHTESAYANHNTVIDPKGSPEYERNVNNTEFDIPISGSFIRICAMKNTYVVAHVLPGNVSNTENGSGTDGKADAAVYVLDETGSPIPYKPMGADDNASKTRGYVAAIWNNNGALNDGANSTVGTMRIDFAANAGKEYFICAKDASISLARLEVVDDKYKPAKSSKLELTGGTNNSEIIKGQYNDGKFYRDATLSGRTLTAGKWTSIVLPFSMNEKKFEEVFGTGAKCLHFTDVSIPNKTVYLTHHYYNMIVAGRPVFVRPGSDFNNSKLAEITDVTLQAKEVINHSETNGFQFVASYDNATINKNDLFMNDNNAIQFLNETSATYPGMRSFIKNNNAYDFNANVHNTKAMFLNFDDEVEEATGIDELIAEEFGEDVIVVTKSTKVYDLNGRMVAEGKDIDRLPAGIYIVNGKKYIVK